jgi:NAD-dependent deacetylase
MAAAPQTDTLVELLSAGALVTVVTGAGVSAASNVPTFRGDGGLWRRQRPEELATARAFAADPAMVWEWYDWRRGLVAACQPNVGHEVLAAWSQRWSGFTLVTQNVDGLHERAGTKGVVRFHGSLWEVQCWSACRASPARWWDERVPLEPLPPACPHCDGILRPGVVWFGEAIDGLVLERSSKAAASCDVFLVVGTSSLVHPAAALIDLARRGGAYTVEINPEATPVTSRVDLALSEPAELALDRLEQLLAARGGA